MKVATVVGARPQFIKAATVSRALVNNRPDVIEILVHTGQHFDTNMSEVFFDELDIPRPKYNLGVGGGTHGQNTGRMIEQIEQVIFAERPDYLLVYGDTDSTLAGAIAASKLHIGVIHVEAGLRSRNMAMPEEINRILVDHISERLYCPTPGAQKNLVNEGIDGSKGPVVGDVMFDAAVYYADRASERSDILARQGLSAGQYVLTTLHRAENVDDVERLARIVRQLGTSPLPVIWPVHPRTKSRLKQIDIALPDSVSTIDPVGYLDMIMLEKSAALIVTDSGGVQKEAYFHGRPCLVVRRETEWVELIQIGAAKLADDHWWEYLDRWTLPLERPYGDGKASEAIALDLGRWS